MYENHPNPGYNPLGILSLAWDVYREMSGSNGEFVIDGNLTSVEYPDKLRAVRVPTLIIAGEHDAVSLGMSKEMNANIAGSRLVLLPRSKHMTFVDQPDMFNCAVDSFIHAAETTSR